MVEQVPVLVDRLLVFGRPLPERNPRVVLVELDLAVGLGLRTGWEGKHNRERAGTGEAEREGTTEQRAQRVGRRA